MYRFVSLGKVFDPHSGSFRRVDIIKVKAEEMHEMSFGIPQTKKDD